MVEEDEGGVRVEKRIWCGTHKRGIWLKGAVMYLGEEELDMLVGNCRKFTVTI